MDILAILAAIALQLSSVQVFSMSAESMMPTLMAGDHFVVAPFGGEGPQRGDIVIFRGPRDPSVTYVKRLVGLPGDRVQMIDGRLFLNDVPVPRRRMADFDTTDQTGTAVAIARYRETLPDGRDHEILELSDAGFLDNTPVFEVPAGHLFVMGDHRDNSLDSRIPASMGYIPVENLVGRALYRWADGTLQPVR